jgi:hypothetical protein
VLSDRLTTFMQEHTLSIFRRSDLRMGWNFVLGYGDMFRHVFESSSGHYSHKSNGSCMINKSGNVRVT